MEPGGVTATSELREMIQWSLKSLQVLHRQKITWRRFFPNIAGENNQTQRHFMEEAFRKQGLIYAYNAKN